MIITSINNAQKNEGKRKECQGGIGSSYLLCNEVIFEKRL
jgi:hypothetical protein